MKPRMKNHFRAHQLSVWLRLIPELHRAGMEDVVARHNLFRNHNNADLYDGAVRPDPLSRVSYYDPTMELFRKRPNSTYSGLDSPTTMDTIVTTCVNVVSSSNYRHPTFQHHNTSTDNNFANLESSDNIGYNTALSVTIAIGCSLLILNVLIFAGVYYQRDKTKIENKDFHQEQRQNQDNFQAITKHGHYHMGHSQSANVIVDVEQDTSAMILAANTQHEINKMQHLCPSNIQIKAPPPSPNVMMQNCMTLPKKNSSMQHHVSQNYNHGGSSCMTLPKNSAIMNNTACVIAEMQQMQHHTNVQPPNGSVPMPMSVPRPPPPPRSKSPPENQPLLPVHNHAGNKGNMRVPQAAMSEMRV